MSSRSFSATAILAGLILTLCPASEFSAAATEDLRAPDGPMHVGVPFARDIGGMTGPVAAEGALSRDFAAASFREEPPRARFFTINQVLAKRNGAPGSRSAVRLAAAVPVGSASDAPPPLAVAPRNTEPFGLFAFRAPEGLLWAKWRTVSAAIQREAEVLSACRRTKESCSHAAGTFVSIIDAAVQKEGRRRYEAVNRAINSAVRYASDPAQHGLVDLWSAPLATLASGRGDCEDYAIAKYVALREAGTSRNDLRLVLVHDRAASQHHAVLAARHDGRWLILDNRWSDLRADEELSFTPLFALSSDGVKLFAAPYAMRAVAGADIAPATSLAAGGSLSAATEFAPEALPE